MSESESPLEETPKRAKKKVYLQRAHVDRYTTQKKTEEQRQDSTGIESDKPAEFKGWIILVSKLMRIRRT